MNNQEIARKDAIYVSAVENIEKGLRLGDISACEFNLVRLRSIYGWKDTITKIDEYEKEIRALKASKEQKDLEEKRKRAAEEARLLIQPSSSTNNPHIQADQVLDNSKIVNSKDNKRTITAKAKIIASIVLVVALIITVSIKSKIDKKKAYDQAMAEATALMDANDYDGAEVILKKLGYSISDVIDMQRAHKYNKGMTLMREGNYLDGFPRLMEFGVDETNESKQFINSHWTEIVDAFINNATVGSRIYLGWFHKYGTSDNRAIEWIVLAKEEGKMLVISDDVIDAEPYHYTSKKVSWEDCHLRSYINNELYNEIFSEKEKQYIVKGEDTMFVLSVDEAKTYFSSDIARQCGYTTYASWEKDLATKDGSCVWWLRSSSKSTYAPCVGEDGKISTGMLDVSWSDIGIRPAMWISCEE